MITFVIVLNLMVGSVLLLSGCPAAKPDYAFDCKKALKDLPVAQQTAENLFECMQVLGDSHRTWSNQCPRSEPVTEVSTPVRVNAEKPIETPE
jgi:hypothetical protein